MGIWTRNLGLCSPCSWPLGQCLPNSIHSFAVLWSNHRWLTWSAHFLLNNCDPPFLRNSLKASFHVLRGTMCCCHLWRTHLLVRFYSYLCWSLKFMIICACVLRSEIQVEEVGDRVLMMIWIFRAGHEFLGADFIFRRYNLCLSCIVLL